MLKKNKRSTRIKKAISVAMMSALLGSFGLVTAKAGNVTLSPFKFELTYYWGEVYDYTELRTKMDDSSVYMEYRDGRFTFTASVVAGYSENSYVPDDDIRRVEIHAEQGCSYYLINYVKESGYDYAAIRGETDDDILYEAIGVWSPDSL